MKLNLEGSRRQIKEKATERALGFFYREVIHGDLSRKQATPKK
jgi:hypothetical protein